MRTRSRKRLFQQFCPKLERVIETQPLVRVTLLAFLGYMYSPILKFAATLEHIIYLCRKCLSSETHSNRELELERFLISKDMRTL